MKKLQLLYYVLALTCLSLFCYQNILFFLEYRNYPTARSGAFEVRFLKNKKFLVHFVQDITNIEFPRLIMCHANGKGYNISNIEALGYKNQVSFLYGKADNASEYGWVANNMSAREIFQTIYAQPMIEDLIRNDSFLKLNGSIREQLKWIEVPMVHPEGRCLKLNWTKTNFTETTLILKFSNIKFAGALELSITDPYREYYKPDIFTFSGDKIKLDFREAGSF